MFLIILKFGFLFVGVLLTITNTIKIIIKNDIPAVNIIYQAIGITGFIALQWLI